MSDLSTMRIAHEKLDGLPRERVLAAVAPVLEAHRVDCVELVWRTDRGTRVLEVTLEQPGTTDPGAGVTLELCTEISRDLSAALDVADCIPQSYKLEVGSPGVERALYGRDDYVRFAGQLARLKLKVPLRSGYVVHGRLKGLDDAGRVIFDEEGRGELVTLEFESIESARLVFEWKTPGARAPGGKHAAGRRAGSHGKVRRPQGSK